MNQFKPGIQVGVTNEGREKAITDVVLSNDASRLRPSMNPLLMHMSRVEQT